MQLPIQGTHHVHLTREKETLLITLYAKALDYRSKHPILGDKAADTWAVDDTGTIDRLDSQLQKTTEISVFALPSVRKLPLMFRVLFTAARMNSNTRNMLRLLRYQF